MKRVIRDRSAQGYHRGGSVGTNKFYYSRPNTHFRVFVNSEALANQVLDIPGAETRDKWQPKGVTRGWGMVVPIAYRSQLKALGLRHDTVETPRDQSPKISNVIGW